MIDFYLLIMSVFLLGYIIGLTENDQRPKCKKCPYKQKY